MTHPAKIRRHITELSTVPVLFANGRDDDLPGFIAACRNERFSFDGRIYEPGEDFTLSGATQSFSCGRITINLNGYIVHIPNIGMPSPGRCIYIKAAHPGRNVLINHSNYNFGQAVMA